MTLHISKVPPDRNVGAWLLMVTALTVHVFDETVTHFLPLYNGLVETLFGATVLVARDGRVIRRVAIVFGILMIFNALGHLTGSVYWGYVLPGAYSSPFAGVGGVHGLAWHQGGVEYQEVVRRSCASDPVELTSPFFRSIFHTAVCRSFVSLDA